jgi:hypothetical protein
MPSLRMKVPAGMAELADAADLKSAGLKKLVGVRVPLSAPSLIPSIGEESLKASIAFLEDPSTSLPFVALRVGIAPVGFRFAHARKGAQL